MKEILVNEEERVIRNILERRFKNFWDRKSFYIGDRIEGVFLVMNRKL